MACSRTVVGASLLLALALAGCATSPPPSRFPTADDALSRMHATFACSRGVQGEAKIDFFKGHQRVRGNVLYLAVLPEKVRFDVYSPFGVTLSTLTSNGQRFALFDLTDKQFLYGPANACNVARFTEVPVPPFALVELLRGEAPVLVHTPAEARIEWSSGSYLIRISSKHAATEQIRLVPRPDDWYRPWQQQRVRVLEVGVEQQGIDLYRALMEDHEAAHTAKPRVDPNGLLPPVPASGPVCSAEVPRRIRMEVPGTDQDLILVDKSVTHNPPLIAGVFSQQAPGGVSVRYATCGD
jgi:hypothetical protein